MKKTAFAIAAHPDDIEFMMSGTLALLKDAGYEIHYMNLADGALGSMTLSRARAAALRKKEAEAACSFAGAHFHKSIAQDVALFYDFKTLAKLLRTMREVAPEIVLTHGPYDYMEDHVNAGRLAASAAFCRAMPNFRCVKAAPVQNDVALYHAMPHSVCDALNRPVIPDFFIDVSKKIDFKRDMLACHKSQKDWLDLTQGKGSYLEAMDARMAHFGRMSGRFKFAEAWIRHNPTGFCAQGFDPLCAALKKFLKKNKHD